MKEFFFPLDIQGIMERSTDRARSGGISSDRNSLITLVATCSRFFTRIMFSYRTLHSSTLPHGTFTQSIARKENPEIVCHYSSYHIVCFFTHCHISERGNLKLCSNVVVSGITILAPIDSPNTDGIDPGIFLFLFLFLFF